MIRPCVFPSGRLSGCKLASLALAIAVLSGCTDERAADVSASSADPQPVLAAAPAPEVTTVSPADAAADAKRISGQVPMELIEGVSASLWASEKLLADPVALNMDYQGRAWITVTHRSNNSEFDIRPYPHWLTDSISFETVEDRRAFLKRTFATDKNLGEDDIPDRNEDGLHDWRDLAVVNEEVWVISDANTDGVADGAHLYLRDFNSEVTDVLGGIYYNNQREEVYLAVAPNAWTVKDTTGDGMADSKKAISDGFGVHIGFSGHGMSGITQGPDGRVYYGIGDVGADITDNDGNHYPHPNNGVIVRSEPDGSNFEVFAYGVRNTHEFTFDKYGNLITVDNDGDHPGESERLVYLIDGSDSGWRINWQFGKYTDPKNNSYKVWMDEKYHTPHFDGQAAHILPPIAPYHNGPTGMTYNPGTALSERWQDHFFVVEFVGTPSRSGIHAFTLEPDGASFDLTSDEVFMRGILSTGLDFGPDGALYTTDWIEGWGRNGKGRLWKLDTPETTENTLRQDTQSLLAADFTQAEIGELSNWLAHADMRVRSKAQFELVERGAADSLQVALKHEQQLGRVHAIWGVGQLARGDIEAAAVLLPLLEDADPEIRAQAARVLGDVRYSPATGSLIANLTHEHARARFFAAEALGRIGASEATAPLVTMLEANNGEDVYLRQAGAIALGRIGDADALSALTDHASDAVRAAAVVALGRMRHPAVAEFLTDSNEHIATDAARLINDDLFIDEALPLLAETLETTPFNGEPLLRRAINANLFGGARADAERLVEFAARADRPEVARAEAIATLANWAEPSVFDRVSGRYRGERSNNGDDAKAALSDVYPTLLEDDSDVVRAATTRALGGLGYADATRLLRERFDQDAAGEVRLAALESLQGLNYAEMGEVIFKAMNDTAVEVRVSALAMLPQLELPVAQTVEMHTLLLENATVQEQQTALKSLATIAEPEAEAALMVQMQKLIDGDILPEVQLDLVNAAKAFDSAELNELLASYEASKDKDKPLDMFRESLQGGNARNGWGLFMYSNAAQCIRCHVVGEQGGPVGPNLTDIGLKLTREQLLESMVDPSARIAPGFGQVSLTLKDGSVVEGLFTEETDTHKIIGSGDDAIRVAKADIVSQQNPPSGMPPMHYILDAGQIRDLVEYLTKLDGTVERPSH
ncbi:MAG TPA: HEAT repeat domain-containing protein [Cellvibrionaceae bacterium]